MKAVPGPTSRIVTAYKAQPVVSPVPGVVIRIEHVLRNNPDGNGEVFESDAVAITDALFDALPGGTIHQLLIEMMKRTASELVVPYGGQRKKKMSRS